MFSILWSSIAGAVAGIVSCLLFLRLKGMAAAHSTVSQPAAAEPAQPLVNEPTSAPASDSPAPASRAAPPPENVATVVLSLSKTLSPLAEEVSHPRELLEMPEFQGIVAAFRRPDATFEFVAEYALGANWPLACAAFLVLSEHSDRQSICDQVVRRLPYTRPYVLTYALRFLTSLRQRPPMGAAILAAQDWWQKNPVIPGFLQEYFARSAELGDQPDFGTYLENQAELNEAAVVGLLQKIQHPFASRLLEALRNWRDTRIDRAFLSTVGTLWDPAEQDTLMVVPANWQEALESAEAAIQQARPRSILVCGDPRTGKTSLIKLLGHRLQRAGWTVFAASGNELMAGQIYIGQLEGRIRDVVAALHTRRKIVWYVHDLVQLADSGMHKGQSASILDQILPAMAAGNLIIIGETSQAAATRLLQVRPSLRSLTEVLLLQPMSEGETSALATQVSALIAQQSSLQISQQAITAAMDLAQHYLGTGQLPGVVLELLKRAVHRSVSAGETTLTQESVVATLSQISGLPPAILDNRQRVDLAKVQEFFTRRVMGQDEAIKAIVDRIAMLKAGLTDPGRPIGVFLFAGPTGTGKTELAKTLAEFLFGAADRMLRLDMSEFQTAASTSKILGDRDDHSGGALIDRIRKQPFSVVLLDEFEKAHPNCWDLFLQIFDDGRLSDAHGRVADFRHCIIILTSNLGATLHRGSGLGFRPDSGSFAEEQVLRTISQTFRPEFVNRLDKMIVFRPLSRDLMRDILHKELTRVQERRGLRDRGWAVEWEASAIEFLLDRGFSPEMGARPLKRAIDQLLLAPLAATLVERRFPEGDQFLFVRSNGKVIEVEFVDPDAEQLESSPREADDEDELSLPATILRPLGTSVERASLAACWRELQDELGGETWKSRLDQTRLVLADPAIWSRDDRHRFFSRVELADRIAEAARTADRLFQRYNTANQAAGRGSRELASRLALQLYNLRQGIDDFHADAPVDALLRVDPTLEVGGTGADSAAWCRRLLRMYTQWAAKRRMQAKEIPSTDRNEVPILLITGFGAFRTLSTEAGLHVLEDMQDPNSGRRIVARVTTAAGPEQAMSASGEFAIASQLLDSMPVNTNIIRRYREHPAPLVRDIVGGWRSGRLAAILDGDFELIGAIKRRQAPA